MDNNKDAKTVTRANLVGEIVKKDGEVRFIKSDTTGEVYRVEKLETRKYYTVLYSLEGDRLLRMSLDKYRSVDHFDSTMGRLKAIDILPSTEELRYE